MQFRKYLNEDSVYFDKDLKSMDDVFSFLSEKFSSLCGLSQEYIKKQLVSREKLGSTYIGNNILLPHTHLKDVSELHLIIIRLKSPLLLENGKRVDYIFSILTNGEEETLYLNILQGIGNLFKDHRASLDSCQNSNDLFPLLESFDFQAGKLLDAQSLAENWPSIQADQSLSQALDLMKRENLYFLPVLDPKSKKITGVIDLIDLLKAGFPDYIFSLNSLSMIHDFQPLKYFWTKEADLMVGDFIRDYKNHIIRKEASYPEIFFILIKSNRRHLIVLDENEKILGVISPNRIIDTMLRP